MSGTTIPYEYNTLFIDYRAATTICVAVLFPRCYHLRLDGGMDYSGVFRRKEKDAPKRVF